MYTKLAKEQAKKTANFPSTWIELIIEELLNPHEETNHEHLLTLLILQECFPLCTDIDEFCFKINEIFKSDNQDGITLSTIHGAKGDESDTVFFLGHGRLPLSWKDQIDDEYKQECNLVYVAYTRFKKRIFLDSSAKKEYSIISLLNNTEVRERLSNLNLCKMG